MNGIAGMDRGSERKIAKNRKIIRRKNDEKAAIKYRKFCVFLRQKNTPPHYEK
jgi:hypothetical protein